MAVVKKVRAWATGSNDLPVVAAAVLALLAVLETLSLARNSDAPAPVALLLALSATVPLAFIRTQAALAATAVTSAIVMTVAATDERPPLAALMAQMVIVYVLGLQFIRLLRDVAARRDASREAIADTLLEFAVRGERARIARELHDVVAHHLSMISVQAETARLTTPGMPAEGAKRLSAIGDTARAALTEMRRLLSVLRDDGPAASTARLPQPGLQQLNELVDEARDFSRASTRLIVRGRITPLDPGIELTAFRIIQEALTNARRHAPGAAVDVELHYTEDALRLRVRDNGPGAGTSQHVYGHGLLGMRERTDMVSGMLSVGPAPGSGVLVEAELPR